MEDDGVRQFYLGECNVENALVMDGGENLEEGAVVTLSLCCSTERQDTCAICYYDSEEDDEDEETLKLEAEFAKETLAPIHRYAQLGIETSEESPLPVCSHKFHTVCLYNWVTSDHGGFTCPICRSGLQKQRITGFPKLFRKKPTYCIKYWANGNIKEEYYKEQDQLHGIFKEYFEGGGLKRECSYNHGVLRGLEKCYYEENGNLKSEVEFEENVKHGQCRRYTITGQLIGESNWDRGQKHGAHIEWFTDTNRGRMRAIEHHNHGQRHGVFMRWSYRGDLLMYGVYRNGEKDGRFIAWNESPHCLRLKEFYVNGVRHGRSVEYHEPQRKEKKGALKHLGFYEYGAKVGLWRTYWSNGQLKEQTEHNSDGLPDGLSRQWNRFGQLLRVFRYDHGELNGVCETYSENGIQVEAANYREGQLHGLYVRRYKGDGKPKLIKVFNHNDVVLARLFNRQGAIVWEKLPPDMQRRKDKSIMRVHVQGRHQHPDHWNVRLQE